MRNKMKVKKGDRVIVIAGKDKGKSGEIIRAIPAERRVVVQGVNVVKRHTKPSQASPGGLVEKEAPIHVSNVKLVCPSTGKPSRVGMRMTSDGSKERIRCKANYRGSGGGNQLALTLRCASDSYKFDLSSNVTSSGDRISGNWSEASRNVNGSLQGGRIVRDTVSGSSEVHDIGRTELSRDALHEVQDDFTRPDDLPERLRIAYV